MAALFRFFHSVFDCTTRACQMTIVESHTAQPMVQSQAVVPEPATEQKLAVSQVLAERQTLAVASTTVTERQTAVSETVTELQVVAPAAVTQNQLQKADVQAIRPDGVIVLDQAQIADTAAVTAGTHVGTGHDPTAITMAEGTVRLSGKAKISGNARVTGGHCIEETLDAMEARHRRELEQLRMEHEYRMAMLMNGQRT
ncbi:hypothetical protein CC1G_04771 [Coprinopsis cinerea okayama7|uniref:Uncharacterized protein n=1 Tax=Coprinopsis cinerea (strain Okayama-7 / 130 / ATCC MYA-4618 / FGSC 9003) TaxID=240176 RepID=A8P2I2_COPC7|nr:hypothetical protein CC1G_04771 [Coprinopsis cinerea okayama7\|eukprot:XP_001838327.1 hypothetical protein CC1G_04771 [Coprinopsis cinerea okayama7\